MKVSKALADYLPACNCGEYYVAGESLQAIKGRDGTTPVWWASCTRCGNTLGHSWEYPVNATSVNRQIRELNAKTK